MLIVFIDYPICGKNENWECLLLWGSVLVCVCSVKGHVLTALCSRAQIWRYLVTWVWEKTEQECWMYCMCVDVCVCMNVCLSHIYLRPRYRMGYIFTVACIIWPTFSQIGWVCYFLCFGLQALTFLLFALTNCFFFLENLFSTV